MKKLLYWVVLMVLTACSKLAVDAYFDAQTVGKSGTRYLDDVFSETKTWFDIEYGQAYNFVTHRWDTLLLDVHFPSGDFGSQNRWSIVFAHGGGFYQGDKSVSFNQGFCDAMARKGYVVFNINYRLTDYLADSSNYLPGYEMAGADMRAAVRFVRSVASQRRLDPNRITVFGSSAGGFASLGALYDAALDSSNQSNLGWSSEPNLGGESAGAIPDTNLIEAGEPALYVQHCVDDLRVPFQNALDIVSRLTTLSISNQTWFPQGQGEACHRIFVAKQDTTVEKLSSWIYSRFGSGI